MTSTPCRHPRAPPLAPPALLPDGPPAHVCLFYPSPSLAWVSLAVVFVQGKAGVSVWGYVLVLGRGGPFWGAEVGWGVAPELPMWGPRQGRGWGRASPGRAGTLLSCEHRPQASKCCLPAQARAPLQPPAAVPLPPPLTQASSVFLSLAPTPSSKCLHWARPTSGSPEPSVGFLSPEAHLLLSCLLSLRLRLCLWGALPQGSGLCSGFQDSFPWGSPYHLPLTNPLQASLWPQG